MEVFRSLPLEGKLFCCPLEMGGEHKANSADVGVHLGPRDRERHQGCASFMAKAYWPLFKNIL